jgi:hypothetical protein
MPLESADLITDGIQVLREAFGISRAALAQEMKVQTSLLDELLSARFDTEAYAAATDNVVSISVERRARTGGPRRTQ